MGFQADELPLGATRNPVRNPNSILKVDFLAIGDINTPERLEGNLRRLLRSTNSQCDSRVPKLTLSTKDEISIKDEIAARGCALIQGWSSDIDTVSVARMLGEPMTPWDGGLIQKLIPRASSTPNTYSGIFGLNRFPFHTDLAHWRLPPRYLLLRCVSGYADVPTLLLDGEALIESVTLDILKRAIFKPRRPKDGSIVLLRLCEGTDDGYRLRWDEIFLKPASKVGDIANERVREYLMNRAPMAISLAQCGDMLLIDNWRMLHARSPIPVGREDRTIDRIYLERLH